MLKLIKASQNPAQTSYYDSVASLLTLWDSPGLRLWALRDAAGQREPCGERGVGRRWRGAGHTTGVACRERSWLVYLQERAERGRLRGVGQAPAWVSLRGVRVGEGCPLPADLGSSDAFRRALVAVCQEKQVRVQRDGGPQGRGDPGKADGIYMYFALLGFWCVGKSRGSVWWGTSPEGREMCLWGFFVFFSQIISRKIVRFYKVLDNETSHALPNLGMRQTLRLCRRIAAFIFASGCLKRNQPPRARHGKGGPWHPWI